MLCSYILEIVTAGPAQLIIDHNFSEFVETQIKPVNQSFHLICTAYPDNRFYPVMDVKYVIDNLPKSRT